MPAGFFWLLAAQFLSGLADHAVLIVAIAYLQEQRHPLWWAPLLKFAFTWSYVLLAPVAGAWADAVRKNLVHFRPQRPSHYLIVSGDQLYRMDLADMLTGSAEHYGTEERQFLALLKKCTLEASLVERGRAAGARDRDRGRGAAGLPALPRADGVGRVAEHRGAARARRRRAREPRRG